MCKLSRIKDVLPLVWKSYMNFQRLSHPYHRFLLPLIEKLFPRFQISQVKSNPSKPLKIYMIDEMKFVDIIKIDGKDKK